MLERTVELWRLHGRCVRLLPRARRRPPLQAIPTRWIVGGRWREVYSARRRKSPYWSLRLPFMDGPTLAACSMLRKPVYWHHHDHVSAANGIHRSTGSGVSSTCCWFDATWNRVSRKFSVVIPEELRTHVPTRARAALPFFSASTIADF